MTLVSSVVQTISASLIESLVPSAGGGLPIPDWSNWDGSNDLAPQRFYTSNGFSSPTAFVFTGNQEFVSATRVRSGGGDPEGRFVTVNSMDGDYNITQESSLELSLSNGTFPSIVKLTDDRILVTFFTTSVANIFLLSKSGTVLAEIDADNSGSFIVSGARNAASAKRLSDTKAVLFYSDSNSFYSVIIDVSGDTISFGTPVDTTENSARYSGVDVLNESSFVVAVSDRVFLYSVSGTTITLEDNINIKAAGGALDDIDLFIRNENQFIIAYEDDNAGTDTIDANIFTVTGTSLSRGTEVEIASGTRLFAGPQSANLCRLNNDNFLFVGSYQDISTSQTRGSTITLDGDVMTVGGTVLIAEGDHGYVRVIPNTNGAYALLVTQDGTTSPIDQTSYTVINGSS